MGVINGTLLGLLLGAVAIVWKGNFFLGGVVAASLALNTVVSVLLGGLVPLFLKSRKVDPALASGPILTTCTDMFGFFPRAFTWHRWCSPNSLNSFRRSL